MDSEEPTFYFVDFVLTGRKKRGLAQTSAWKDITTELSPRGRITNVENAAAKTERD